MTDKDISPSIAALRKLEASLHLHLSREHGEAEAPRAPAPPASGARVARLANGLHCALRAAWRRPLLRRLGLGLAGVVLVVGFGVLTLWWRLSTGPISLDLITPWLTAAVEQNFGDGRSVEVGGTQIERDEHGRMAVRIRDIVVRDADGTVVATAPKAEVGVSGSSLLTGEVRAERLSLVGAGMSVRIEPDGRVTVFAGADNRPIATASATPADAERAAAADAGPDATPTATVPAERAAGADLNALLAWIDGLGATGLDGHDLGEIGLKSGQLVVDDQRSGKRLSFDNIDLSLTRPSKGGVVLKLASDGPHPWSLRAAAAPSGEGRRAISIEAQKVSFRDLMLAVRMGDGEIDADLPLSLSLRGEIAADGKPLTLQGRLVAENGTIADPDDPNARLAVDRFELMLDWDAGRRTFRAPFQLVSGGNRFTSELRGESPVEEDGAWAFAMSGGAIVLGPVEQGEQNLVLNRILARGRLDATKRRIQFDQFDVGNAELKIALSGTVDFASSDSRMALGLAANRMSMSALKRLWPSMIAPKTRAWIKERIAAGNVERVVIATNMPLASLRPDVPIPDDGLSVEINTTATVLAPVEGLPPIRDADLNMRVIGRAATITLGRGAIELPSGRKLSMTGGTFEVADTSLDVPMSRTRFRLEGPVPAAAEFLSLDPLRDDAGVPLDPATSRGTVSAQVTLGLPLLAKMPKGSTSYTVSMDVANFVAERMVMGHKVEAAALRVHANANGYQIKGDVKIQGMPAALEYRKARGEAEAEVRVQATMDDAARTRFGLEAGQSLDGPVAVKLSGRVGGGDRESRLNVEADMTQAKIDNLLPGWLKPAGKPARVSFVLVKKPQSTRFEDLLVDGSGVLVKGQIEIDASGEIMSANLPVFSMSDGDKATLKADRSADGVLRATMRGDVYDGRGFLKSAMAGSPAEKGKRKPGTDLDLDIKLGIVAGFHGETLRAVDLKLSRRSGHIRTFLLSAKLGRDTPLNGDLRGRAGRQVLYFETNDAGALFRLTDTYPKIFGGQMWVAMDPPTPDQAPQEGTLNIRNFAVRGETALDRVAASAPGTARSGVEFSRMRVEFTKTPGRLSIRDGLVRGPVIGATIDGNIDYARDDVRMRGTFVPLYGLNNMFGQIPIVGMFLGGSNEGLVGITYEVVGPPSAPVLRVNPISAVAPGVFRKFFEFPSANGRGAPAPEATR